ncbi:helix-turn-helix transcriptional regulator [Rhizobium sp. TRM95111]|uniref:helix-turn-helix domain-containing protein n=1 Tax=Rhizobium alarense TaxID=2846851 RepID=UPI001F310100|nr:helix-turn-helix transcriptional regulator [Rhizobium alarense]MCF3642304.1 helix-turn-helix transcriptional regulator [Rhizobium alarense]
MERGDRGSLTKRERQVLALIGQGLDSRKVAAVLGIAYFTVRKHRSNILAKLGLHDAAALSAFAAAGAGPNGRQNPASALPGPP